MAMEVRGNRGMRITTDWHGDTARGRARRGAARGVEAGAEHVRAVSVDRTPIQTGALRNSATVSHDPDSGTAAVAYTADYAVYQHEDLDYQHDTGGPKFLESTLVSERGAVARLIQAQLRAALRS